ncbi:hypothetical protein [Bifidobacterium catenulatum]|uniref:hypothetical protein n=1 Tax=Bifidobacterium catenulatum TaxID=1686 RepID=UPI003263B3F1
MDGKAGTAHISSEDKAIIHQAKFGAGDMVFEWGDAMSCTMQSANKAVIGTGCASIQGLDWHITNPETVTIQSGSSGKNRNDIICAHYHRETSTGVEKVELVAFKGVPSDAAAVDPTIPSAKILNGAADAYMPLWRIPLTGITAGTPVRLFNKRYALWDSVTLPFGNGNGNSNGGIYPIGKVSSPNAIKSLNGRATLSSGTTVAIPFIHPSYLQRSVQVSIAPDGTVNLLVGPEITVTGGIVEIHF